MDPIGGIRFNYCLRGGISGASMPFMPEAPLLPEAPDIPLPEVPEGSDIHNAQSIIKPET